MAGREKGEKPSKTPPAKRSRPGAGGLIAILAGSVAIFTLIASLSSNTFWRGNRSAGPQPAKQSASAIEHISGSQFDERVLQSREPILVDFYADWCGPCQLLAPVLEEVAKETPHAKIVKVNVDQNRELAVRYRIDAIPTLLVFRNGNLVNRHTGLADAASLKQLLQ
jgi:thioredoxin 1